MTEERKIISAAIDTLTGKVLFTLRVPIRWTPKKKWWDFRKKKVETERVYQIWPSVVCNQIRIIGKALSLPAEIYEETTQMFPIFAEHQRTMLYIVAAAIQNNHLEPDPELILFLERNVEGQDLLDAMMASLQQLNMQAFFDSIVLMNGTVKIVSPKEKTSPLDGSELIASHTQ
jgi:hypothetical protein